MQQWLKNFSPPYLLKGALIKGYSGGLELPGDMESGEVVTVITYRKRNDDSAGGIGMEGKNIFLFRFRCNSFRFFNPFECAAFLQPTSKGCVALGGNLVTYLFKIPEKFSKCNGKRVAQRSESPIFSLSAPLLGAEQNIGTPLRTARDRKSN
ncbi:hypothetical protein CEXT_422701 [Caerostris extrusa]|uniref:Uncharacterized protein n=1 Tax=Caerostris extrusa TaxID=172846 RepID=A0AAV4Y1L2_CAEEX|nr:hypothetical protein CEXT_422701 [Caerostris extrusa]